MGLYHKCLLISCLLEGENLKKTNDEEEEEIFLDKFLDRVDWRKGTNGENQQNQMTITGIWIMIRIMTITGMWITIRIMTKTSLGIRLGLHTHRNV